MTEENILCVGNWESDMGYAWKMIERFWEALALRYPGRVIVCYKQLRELSPRLVAAGIRIEQFDFNPSKPREMLEYVRSRKVRHVYLSDRPFWSVGYAALRAAGVSVIVHDHCPGDRPKPKGIKRLVKSVLARSPLSANAYIAVSDFTLHRFMEVGCLPARKCHLATNGIDLVDQAPVDIRAELGIPEEAPLVVSSSRVTRYKRVHHIAQAAVSVPAYFIHCGDGPDMPFLRAEVERLGLTKRFFLLGNRNDVTGILRSADIAAHASEGEVGMCLSILEFMQARLPIVLPNDPTVAGAVIHEKTALLYSPGVIPGLAENLNRLVSDLPVRLALGEAARAAVSVYDIRHTIGAVLSVCGRLYSLKPAAQTAPAPGIATPSPRLRT